jgi:hypothetical protein
MRNALLLGLALLILLVLLHPRSDEKYFAYAILSCCSSRRYLYCCALMIFLYYSTILPHSSTLSLVDDLLDRANLKMA